MSHYQTRSSLAVPWKVTDALAALVFVALFWVAVIVTIWVTDIVALESRSTTLALAFALEGSLLVVALIIGPLRYRVSLGLLGFRLPVGRGRVLLPLLVVVLSLAFTTLYVFVVRAVGLGVLVPPPLPVELRGYGADIPGFVLTVIWGPLAEETFFRGFVFPVFLGRMGLVWAVIASSVLFALSHGIIGLIIPVFFSGILLALLYAWTRSLWSVWSAHALQNALAFTLGA